MDHAAVVTGLMVGQRQLLLQQQDPEARVARLELVQGGRAHDTATDDGKVFSGIRLRESDRDLVLRDAEGREIAIPLDSIEGQKNGNTLMPAGLTASLTRQEILDLAAFLAALGKLPEYTISPQPIVRAWETMQPTSEASTHLRRTSYASAATEPNVFQWAPRIATVKGELPLGELPEIGVKNRVAAGSRGVSFVRCQIEAPADGKVQLKFGDIAGLQAWADDQPINLAATVDLTLSPGPHRITIVVDRSERNSPVSLGL